MHKGKNKSLNVKVTSVLGKFKDQAGFAWMHPEKVNGFPQLVSKPLAVHVVCYSQLLNFV